MTRTESGNPDQMQHRLHDPDIMLKQSRILLAENDPSVCDVILDCLTQSGYTHIESTSSGLSAVRRILEARQTADEFDMLIIDATLKDVAVKDLQRRLRTGLGMPVFLVGPKEYLSAVRDIDIENSGLLDCIAFPFDTEVFSLRVERLLLRRGFSLRLENNERRNRKMFLNVLQVMAKVLETKDSYTMHHSESVSKYARRLGRKFGLSNERLEKLSVAGILHDFGKIGISDTILNKPGKLDDIEYQSVRRHPLIGSMILETLEELGDIIADIRHHHERFDGGGYPTGISGSKIPLGARILCVADSFDAMTSNRSYHKAMSHIQAREELTRCSGKQFDPEAVEHMLEILDEDLLLHKSDTIKS